MHSPKMKYRSLTLARSADPSTPVTVQPDGAERSAEGRADDDGMPVLDSESGSATPDLANGLLDQLGDLTTRGGTRDAKSLHQFQRAVAALRAIPEMSGPFRAKAASAAGWAALLFSSWRHQKYDRAGVSGAARIREFIMRDLVAARHIHSAMAGVTARSPRERIRGAD